MRGDQGLVVEAEDGEAHVLHHLPLPGLPRPCWSLRSWARAGGDMTTVTDCNVFLRRHPEGHG
ncbi:hypothetical protein CLM85_11235 [Streptomyces albidoflavus]|nr:hypothetical protein CLM81_16365 [Streptomyces albidoflavus]PBO24270.1 hypothetical protein CLM85_11235 [Streptomyces albidoflavus]